MTDAMEILFAHAQDWMIKPLLMADPEYEMLLSAVPTLEERLRAMLSDEEKKLLDRLIDERNLLVSYHEQALFRAGFQLAMELATR